MDNKKISLTTLSDMIKTFNLGHDGWKYRTYKLTIFAGQLEAQLAEARTEIERMKRCANCKHNQPNMEWFRLCQYENKCRRSPEEMSPERRLSLADCWKG